ncbi:PREDICTED: ubiquitin carboxyl-terminal hydrolase MINDY-1-like [Lupinus angustifolius]|uniref:ubiquitin carboxyl-terminal hydrolase MINDY-1-like n=1 Tax=Lupinus angustifolius TaxID=3871 RepID=UPI00092E48DD|nr:PREDICTED: ubiquitin carboxyl-terminal hydrolase MINDY-1-like [Lupinus angustifolius]
MMDGILYCLVCVYCRLLFIFCIAAGNVLLLRNNLNLSPDIAEVSQEKLLSLVAERLLDSNANLNNKDVGYVENQQQNIADAIDLLPRLATGIDVNLKFRRIDYF